MGASVVAPAVNSCLWSGGIGTSRSPRSCLGYLRGSLSFTAVRIYLLAVVLAVFSGCRKSAATAPADDASGTVSLQWTGVVAGGFTARAVATWCPSDSLLEIQAVRGDTGFGVALIEPSKVTAGQHPVVAPSVPVPWRPMALAALRWATDSAIKGFEANSGNVTLTDVSATQVSGQIDVRLKHIDTNDTLRLKGTLTRISYGPAKGACGRVPLQ